MFGSNPKCPVDPETRMWIERRMAWLTAEFGHDRLRAGPVVLPTPDFFPDPYDGSEPAVGVLFDRVCGYMGVQPDQIEISLYQERVPVQEGSLVPGTGGLYVEGDGKFHIWLNEANVEDPAALIATIAHELGHVLLLGQRRISADEPDHEPLTDLLTVFLGLGVITANSVIHENSWFSGGWSGWSMGRRGYITMPMYGYALALYARGRSEVRPKWAKRLRADVRQAFNQGLLYLESEEGEPLGTRATVHSPSVAAQLPGPTESASEEHEPLVGETGSSARESTRCVYCDAEVTASGDAEAVCADCLASVEANDRELGEAAVQEEVEFQGRSRVARLTCLVGVLAGVAILLWQLLR
jgi:hypothetical protein